MFVNETLLKVANIKVKFGENLILNNISFDAKEDETIAIIGPNGAGKTVLFRALLGLIPYDGKIEWKEGIKIGYVPQKLFIEPDLPLTTQEFFNLKEKNKKEVENVLFSVGFRKDLIDKNHNINQILKRKIGVLSGGELQRVLIAWALLGHPDILLFDEPTTGIDISTEETIYGLLHKLQEKEKLTIMLISHELQVVYNYATNVICLNKERVCIGPPREVLDKESLAKVFGGHVGIYLHDHHEL